MGCNSTCSSDNLTDPDYWDSEWKGISLPSRLDLRHFGGHCFDVLFRRTLRKGSLNLLEVGCAPGRFMIYFSEHFSYSVTGIDFSPLGYRLTRRNLDKAGIHGTVILGDFLSYPIDPGGFDIIFSAGFIEHFLNPMPVLQRMEELLRPEGYLFATVPNYAGFTGLQRKVMNRDIYDKHNPLSLADLQGLFRKLPLGEVQTGCFGSLRFQCPHPSTQSLLAKALWYATRLGDKSLLAAYALLKHAPESPWLSSHLYAIGKKTLA